jgi:hypothetical protein
MTIFLTLASAAHAQGAAAVCGRFAAVPGWTATFTITGEGQGTIEGAGGKKTISVDHSAVVRARYGKWDDACYTTAVGEVVHDLKINNEIVQFDQFGRMFYTLTRYASDPQIASNGLSNYLFNIDIKKGTYSISFPYWVTLNEKNVSWTGYVTTNQAQYNILPSPEKIPFTEILDDLPLPRSGVVLSGSKQITGYAFAIPELPVKWTIKWTIQPTGPAALNVFTCLKACNAGANAFEKFCRSLPKGDFRRGPCWAASRAGQLACTTFCRAYFGPPIQHGGPPSQP